MRRTVALDTDSKFAAVSTSSSIGPPDSVEGADIEGGDHSESASATASRTIWRIESSIIANPITDEKFPCHPEQCRDFFELALLPAAFADEPQPKRLARTLDRFSESLKLNPGDESGNCYPLANWSKGVSTSLSLLPYVVVLSYSPKTRTNKCSAHYIGWEYPMITGVE